jgi:cystathionine gamma-synthase
MRPGDHLVVGDDAYGGSYRLIARVAGRGASSTPPSILADVDAVEPPSARARPR